VRARNVLFKALVACLTLVGGRAFSAASGQLLRPPNPGAPLAERFESGIREGAGAGGSGFWIGYSIKRLMGERSFIGSWTAPGRADARTLEELIEGRAMTAGTPASREIVVKDAARRALDDIDKRDVPERLILKDIGLLLKMTSAGGKAPEDVQINDLKLSVKLAGLPLVWLGPASDAESLGLLTSLYGRAGEAGAKIREKLIHAVALHRAPDTVVPFLGRVLSGSGDEKVRRAAAFGLGDQDDPRAVEALRRALTSAAPAEVKKAAVWGLAENSQPSALDVLIGAAAATSETAVRKEAVMGLAEKASEKAVRTLERIAFDDKDTEVQKRAVFALADLPEKDATPFLVRVAKTHYNPAVRKAAIYALGDLGGAEAVAALIEIAKGRTR